MDLRTAKAFLILCIALFVCALFWLGLRNITYFDIRNIEVKYDGPVNGLTEQMNRYISPYKGVNLFTADLALLEHNLMSFEGVKNVKIKRYFPSKLIVNVSFYPYQTRVCSYDGNNTFYFLADKTKFVEVSSETYKLFSPLADVKISFDFALFLMKWGSDNGFAQLCCLMDGIGQKSLISNIKYDNNNGNDFGLVIVEMKDLNASLYVREPVTSERLSEALDLIARDIVVSDKKIRFDLYSNALIRRK